MAKHCEWCRRFTPGDTQITKWLSLARYKRIPDDRPRWRLFCRHLCPECRESASHRTPWWRPI